jgi:hypothetical protein
MIGIIIILFVLLYLRYHNRYIESFTGLGKTIKKGANKAGKGLKNTGNVIVNTTTNIVEAAVEVLDVSAITDKLDNFLGQIGQVTQLSNDIESKITGLPGTIANKAPGIVNNLIPDLAKIKDFIDIFGNPQKKIYDPLCVAFYDITGMTTCKASRIKEQEDNDTN